MKTLWLKTLKHMKYGGGGNDALGHGGKTMSLFLNNSNKCMLHKQWKNYKFIAQLKGNILIAHPHLLVRATNEWWVPALVATNASQWLKQLLKVALSCSNCSLVARTSKCGWAIRYSCPKTFTISYANLPQEQIKRPRQTLWKIPYAKTKFQLPKTRWHVRFPSTIPWC